jgi:hypothetical protein
VASGTANGTVTVSGHTLAGGVAVGRADGHASVAGTVKGVAAIVGRVNAGVHIAAFTKPTRADGNADGGVNVIGYAQTVTLLPPLGVTGPQAPSVAGVASRFQVALVQSSAAVDGWYGEAFLYQPQTSGADVNAPTWNDPRRAPVQITAVLTYPYERTGEGRIAPKTQGRYNQMPGSASLAPRISFAVTALPFAPLRGDRLFRLSDSTTWQLAEIHRPDSVRVICDVTMLSTGSVGSAGGKSTVGGTTQ